MSAEKQIVIAKVWRSELPRVVVMLASCAVSVFLSLKFPGSVIRGELLTLGSRTVYLSLPLFWLVPFGIYLELLYRIYNVRYAMDPRFLEARLGVLSLSQNIVRVRYDDIRGVETDQTVLGRALDFGDVQVGTAATAGMEIVMRGIGAPREVREVIERERDRRIAISVSARDKDSEPQQRAAEA